MNEFARDAVLFVLVLGVTLALGRPLIGALRALALRQRAYEDAPATHAKKTGTPTMGGLLFGLALALGLAARHDAQAVALAVLGFGCAAVGFVDDYLAIRRGRNRGLRARTKFAATALVAIVFLALLVHDPTFAQRGVAFAFGSTQLRIPDWAWYALSLLAVLATTHAVNLTDGLDGLATGTYLPPLAVVVWLASRAGAAGAVALLIALGAACIGFLAFNRHPARLFMGDTGSLLLGGMLAGGAIVSGAVLLLPLIGGVFAAETISVIVQVTYFKRTKKRIFRMSPLHHHFELGGWPETVVTHRFWTASALLSLAGAALAR